MDNHPPALLLSDNRQREFLANETGLQEPHRRRGPAAGRRGNLRERRQQGAVDDTLRQPEAGAELPVGVEGIAIRGCLGVSRHLIGGDAHREGAGGQRPRGAARKRWPCLDKMQVGGGDRFTGSRRQGQARGRATGRPRQSCRRVQFLPSVLTAGETNGQPLKDERLPLSRGGQFGQGRSLPPGQRLENGGKRKRN